MQIWAETPLMETGDAVEYEIAASAYGMTSA
jgi:hypothetical protein